MLLATERRGRFFTVSASILVALIVLLAASGRAQAAETLYWNNYSGDPDSIAFANADGTGGGALDLTGVELDGPEGMAVDTVTGRLYIAAYSNGPDNEGQIVYVNLNGGGAGVFTAPGAPVDTPEGLAIDPATRMIYWINTGDNDSIAWARLDGSAGGTLNLTGAAFNEPYRLALDPIAGRVYFGSEVEGKLVVSYANVNNTGGGNVNISGTTPTASLNGIAVDPAGGRVYWLNETAKTLSYASLSGTGGGDVDTSGAAWDEPFGLALDPGAGKAFWANYGGGEERDDAFGVSSFLSGGGGGSISIATAPVDGPQDPILVKGPAGTGAPVVTRSTSSRSSLSCSTGAWAPDYPGSFVYRAPTTYLYQWLRNGAPVGGATAATLTAKSAGGYTCTVTGANQAGSAAQTSAAVNVKAAKLKLTTRKKAKADAGDIVTFKVKAVNQGDLKPKNAKVCVKLSKAAKDDLQAPKCKTASLKGRAKKTLTIKVKVKPGADEGADKLTFQVKGAAGKAAKSKIVVK